MSDEERLGRIEDSLTTAVKRRLVADVPVGVLLSGGVDSSLVTAIAAKLKAGIQTFAVKTEDPKLDESEFAAAVAAHCGTAHTELAVRGNVRSGLSRLIAAMGEPLADASAANVFAIAEKAREHVAVVLTGDGGDEAFGGYRHYLAWYVAGRISTMWSGLLRYPLWAITRIPGNSSGPLHSARTLYRLASTPIERTLSAQSMAMELSTRAALYTREFGETLQKHHPSDHSLSLLPPANGDLAVDRVMETQARSVLPDDYLTKVDNATMAVSLEARCPFLDLDVFELGMRIPADARFRGGKPKSLLRTLAERYVPRQCVRRRKRGFVAPVANWLRRDWPDLVDDLILGPQIEQRQWFRREALQTIVDEHRGGRNHGYLLWGLMVLELWVRMACERTLQAAEVV